MLTYNLKEALPQKSIFEYFVEDNEEDHGIVSLNLDTNTAHVEEFAPSDTGRRYGYHLMTALEEFSENGTLESSGTIMWY